MNSALNNYLYYRVTGVSEGETEIYAISKDGSIESDHKRIIVKPDEEKLVIKEDSSEKSTSEKIVDVENGEKGTQDNTKKTEGEAVVVADNVNSQENVSKESSLTQSVETSSVDSISEGTGNGDGNGNGNGENFNTYDNTEQQNTTETYVLNTSSHKFHYPSCSSVPKISPDNYATASDRDEIIAQGYDPCKRCNP